MNKSIYSQKQLLLQNILRKKRLSKNYRQSDLAKKLGEHQSFVSKYESGERRIDFIELMEICNVLDINIYSFLKEFQEKINETK